MVFVDPRHQKMGLMSYLLEQRYIKPFSLVNDAGQRTLEDVASTVLQRAPVMTQRERA